MCYWCSKELSQWDSSFDYQQHMFLLRNKNKNFQLHTLIWRLNPNVHVEGSTDQLCNKYINKFLTIYQKWRDDDLTRMITIIT